MKVTVCFGRTRVVVPCGDGNIQVRSLLQQAAMRYKRAIAKDPSYWVEVHRLEHGDGGILDLDDMLCDVVDDKDGLVAIYEEQDPHNIGDGTSASSTCTQSPEPFASEISSESAFQSYQASSEIEVTPSVLLSNMPLHVRCSSDSSLVDHPPKEILMGPEEPSKNILTSSITKQSHRQNTGTGFGILEQKGRGTHAYQSLPRNPSGWTTHFQRELARSSVSANHLMVDQWLSKQEQEEEEELRKRQRRIERIEPVGRADSSLDQLPVLSLEGMLKLVEVSNEGGPLGIHVVPFNSQDIRTKGLLVTRLEPGGKAEQERLFQENDCIVKINQGDICNLRFEQAQNIFRQAMHSKVIHFHVVPADMKRQYELLLAETKLSPLRSNRVRFSQDFLGERASFVSAAAFRSGPQPGSNNNYDGPLARSTPDTSRRCTTLPHILVSRTSSAPAPSLHCKVSNVFISSNIKNTGRRLNIQLQKGSEGLGFSITSRDFPIGDSSFIFVKNILPRGAAIQDGRLKAGDRLLEVSGVDLNGKTQEEVATLLRNTSMGSVVNLTVIRQENSILPREVKQGNPDMVLTADGTREFMTFEIPLNDSGSAGLGVSVKGNRSKENKTDLGIFVKSIINGGAASKDGRLCVNDQLIEVNGESLLEKTNHDAMETLRKSMSVEGNKRGMIQLIIARQVAMNNEADPVSYPVSEHPVNNLQDIHEHFISHGLFETTKGLDNVSALQGTVYGSIEQDIEPSMGLEQSNCLDSIQKPLSESALIHEDSANWSHTQINRGRGCNESFRAAIDKSYEKFGMATAGKENSVETLDEDENGSLQSGYQSVSTNEDLNVGPGLKGNLFKDHKQNDRDKVGEKEKKKSEQDEEENKDKKVKKGVLKSLGEMFRFGKNWKDGQPGDKVERKRSSKIKIEDMQVSEEESIRMSVEQQRIQAKTRELREKQAKEREYAEIQDVSHTFCSDEEHTYAGIGSLGSSLDSDSMDNHHYHLPQSPQGPHFPLNLQDNAPPLEALYAQVNKPRNGCLAVPDSEVAPIHHDRIQILKHEFQQAKQEDNPEDSQYTYSLDHSWVSNGMEAHSRLHSVTAENDIQKKQLENRDGFQKAQRKYSSLRWEHSKTWNSWDKAYTPTDGLQSSKESSCCSGVHGSLNEYLGTSNINACVVLETQEGLRQEQRRREQEKIRPLPPQEETSNNTLQYQRDHPQVLDPAPVQAPCKSKGPYRQDVPPSPSQLAKLIRLTSLDKGRQFYS